MLSIFESVLMVKCVIKAGKSARTCQEIRLTSSKQVRDEMFLIEFEVALLC